jgi:hypothetical protein
MKLLSSGYYVHADGTLWRLVPVEPSEAMVSAGRDSRPYNENDGDRLLMDHNTKMTWDALLKAAPISPVEGELVEISVHRGSGE